jgi:hypothetical protein
VGFLVAFGLPVQGPGYPSDELLDNYRSLVKRFDVFASRVGTDSPAMDLADHTTVYKLQTAIEPVMHDCTTELQVGFRANPNAAAQERCAAIYTSCRAMDDYLDCVRQDANRRNPDFRWAAVQYYKIHKRIDKYVAP